MSLTQPAQLGKRPNERLSTHRPVRGYTPHFGNNSLMPILCLIGIFAAVEIG